MRPNDSLSDRELARALRQLDPPAPTSAHMASLARRIMRRATPLLDARRHGAARWWEYAAAWAGTLLPLGAAAGFVASACLAWTSAATAPVRPHATERTALLRVVTNHAPSQDLIDFVLEARPVEHESAKSSGDMRR
jgi:hypothetical protein